MLNNSKGWFCIYILFICSCSVQSENDAWKEVCSLSNTYIKRPTEILPQNQEKLKNTKVNPKDLQIFLTVF